VGGAPDLQVLLPGLPSESLFLCVPSCPPDQVEGEEYFISVRRQAKWDNFRSRLMDTFLMEDGLINFSSLIGSPRL